MPQKRAIFSKIFSDCVNAVTKDRNIFLFQLSGRTKGGRLGLRAGGRPRNVPHETAFLFEFYTMMTVSDPHFAYAALVFVLALLGCYLAVRPLPLWRNRCFCAMMICAALSMITDLAAFELLQSSGQSHLTLFTVLKIFSLLFLTAQYMLFLIFVYLLTGYFKVIPRDKATLFLLPGILCGWMLAFSPFFGNLFWADANGLHRGDFYGVFVGMEILYLVMCLFVLVTAPRAGPDKRLRGAYVAIFLAFAGTLAAVYAAKYPLRGFFGVLGLLVLYLTVVRPDRFSDNESHVYNREALLETIWEYQGCHTVFSLTAVTAAGFMRSVILQALHGRQSGLAELSAFLKHSFKKAGVFYLGSGQYILLHNEKAYTPGFIQEKLVKRQEEPFMLGSVPMLFEVMSLCLNSRITKYYDAPQILRLFRLAQENTASGQQIIIDEELIAKMDRKSAVEKALHRALKMGKVQVYYQPLYNTHSGKITSCEALCRIQDEAMGMLSPSEFIPIAEQAGLIDELGGLVFRKAVDYLKDPKNQHTGLENIGINLSPLQCRRADLAEHFKNIALEAGVSPAKIHLEVTESSITHESSVITTLKDLKAAGFSLALDDYGTGYSNLTAVLELPFDLIKIDRSILLKYEQTRDNILPDTIAMFRHHKLGIVTEGVETSQMRDALIGFGADYLQGFFYSRPIPDKEFTSYVAAFNKIADSEQAAEGQKA